MTGYFHSILLLFCLFVPGISHSQQAVEDSLISENEIQLDSASQAIYGTLSVPVIKEKVPVVLIISGSGPTDRDGNNPFGLKTDSYRMLAHGLAKNGIASLRYDKRGVAKSTPALQGENKLVFGIYVDDAERWVKRLRQDKRFSKVIILGHSEGSLAGMLTANFERTDGYISVSGTAMRADSLLIGQLAKQSAAFADTARSIISHISREEKFFVNKDLEPIFRPSVVPYLRSWFSLSPIVEIALVRCPVLIVQGDHDVQVSVEDARRLAEARPGAGLKIIENMNHILKSAPADFASNVATYNQPSLPLATDLVPAITAFIRSIK